MMKPTRGLTLPELLVALAVVAILIAVAAPSFRGLIEVQRLRGINSQLVTDLQFARNEAAARGVPVRLVFDIDGACYVIFTSTTALNDGNAARCDCLQGAGSACTPGNGTTEVRTMLIPGTLGVKVQPIDAVFAFAFDPATGGLLKIPIDQPSKPMPEFRVQAALDPSRKLLNVLNQSGRPAICSPFGTSLGEAPC